MKRSSPAVATVSTSSVKDGRSAMKTLQWCIRQVNLWTFHLSPVVRTMPAHWIVATRLLFVFRAVSRRPEYQISLRRWTSHIRTGSHPSVIRHTSALYGKSYKQLSKPQCLTRYRASPYGGRHMPPVRESLQRRTGIASPSSDVHEALLTSTRYKYYFGKRWTIRHQLQSPFYIACIMDKLPNVIYCYKIVEFITNRRVHTGTLL